MTKQYIVTLTNNLKPLSSATFRIEAADGSYKKTIKGYPVDSETASAALLLRRGVSVIHPGVESTDNLTKWCDSVINAVLKASE